MTAVDNEISESQIALVREKFAKLSCAQMADSASEFVTPVRTPFLPRNGHFRVSGPVYPVNTNDDMLPCLQALASTPPGWVLFIKNDKTPSEALAGDIFATSAVVQRLGGIVVDGAVRDLDDLAGIDIPVFSTEVTFVSARTTDRRAVDLPHTVRTNEVTVHPGDWFFGDQDGFLVVEQRRAAAVIAAAAVLREREELLRESMRRQGRTLADLTGLDEFLAGTAELRFSP